VGKYYFCIFISAYVNLNSLLVKKNRACEVISKPFNISNISERSIWPCKKNNLSHARVIAIADGFACLRGKYESQNRQVQKEVVKTINVSGCGEIRSRDTKIVFEIISQYILLIKT